jgi:hypothetical protein
MPIYIPPESLVDILNGVGENIIRIRYERLRGHLLQGANPEINTDREVLISRMEQMSFRKDIVTAFDELDRKILAAGKPLDFKACVDLARTIYEEITEDAAKRAATVTGDPLPTGQRLSFAPWKDLLVKAKVLTQEEGELYQKLYSHLSNVSTHRLGSAQEHVRIAKNTVIEWDLLLVGRVQALALPN